MAQHGWDVRVGIDPAALLSEESAALVAEHLSTDLGFLICFIGKPDGVGEAAVMEVARTTYRIVLDDKAQFTTQAAASTATFTGPLEVAVRLLYGRLTPAHTAADIEVKGQHHARRSANGLPRLLTAA
ncbi:hypothetical protein [Kineosporia babensis]|uniref:Uncharacterized protein n=1 Tax=Kineosporia babensis TaxID=499548 RepID=A0A9X1T4I7_9ACTN|nr:hypothetical protein [Kineosporia babensis]MCD5316663.1 hypothetical protein [Kineosporia babensis]